MRVHVGLASFPLAAVAAATICDVVHVVVGGSSSALAALWFGALAAPLAIVAAAFVLTERARGAPVATAAIVYGGVVALCMLSTLVRMPRPDAPTMEAFIVTLAALPLGLVGARLGGDLLDEAFAYRAA